MPLKLDQTFFQDSWTHRLDLRGALKGAVLAAGMGSRMAPLSTRHLPKPMFPLLGKVPLAELWVRRFVDSGITDISMNLCVHAEVIQRHFGDGARFGADISYVEEQRPTGTMGGVCKQALGASSRQVAADDRAPSFAAFKGSTLIVPSGDIVSGFGAPQLEQMYELHRARGAAFSMVLTPVPWDRRADFGTAVLQDPQQLGGELSCAGRITEFREKDPDSPSNLNNASIYIIEKELLELFDPHRTAAGAAVEQPFYDFGKHGFAALMGQHPQVKLPPDFELWGMQYDGPWYDVGNKRDYLRVNEALLDGKLAVELPYQRYPWGYLGHQVELDLARVNIVPPVVIGHGCVVQPGATIGPYAVVGDGWNIGAGATVRNSVLWEPSPIFNDDGKELGAAQRASLDPHTVADGVTIEESIVAGGAVTSDLREATQVVGLDGVADVRGLGWVPSGPRA